jgi:hypothetical protein
MLSILSKAIWKETSKNHIYRGEAKWEPSMLSHTLRQQQQQQQCYAKTCALLPAFGTHSKAQLPHKTSFLI